MWKQSFGRTHDTSAVSWFTAANDSANMTNGHFVICTWKKKWIIIWLVQNKQFPNRSRCHRIWQKKRMDPKLFWWTSLFLKFMCGLVNVFCGTQHASFFDTSHICRFENMTVILPVFRSGDLCLNDTESNAFGISLFMVRPEAKNGISVTNIENWSGRNQKDKEDHNLMKN